jgi:uncharacterized protein
MLTPALLGVILREYRLPRGGTHGVPHWARVTENGLRVAALTGADPQVIELFAVFHDSRRKNEGYDPGHGQRGAALARRLRGDAFELDDGRFALLTRACDGHTGGSSDPEATVLTCWDADRLDLGRVGIRPDPRLLCTAAARSREMISWAQMRSTGRHIPEQLVESWGLDPSLL